MRAGGVSSQSRRSAETCSQNLDVHFLHHQCLGGDTPHLPEIIWLDPARGLEYALSGNQSGSFNEINLGDARQPQGPLGVSSFLVRPARLKVVVKACHLA